MIQVKTFDDENELNDYLKYINESDIVDIKYASTSENEDEYSESFLLIYKSHSI